MGKEKKKRRYGSASANAEKRTSGANYGYLKIPKDVRVFSPETETTAVLDILPYEVTDKNHMDKIEVGTLWYKKPFKVHKNVGPGNDAVICPTTFGKPCPICEHRDELKGNEDNNEDDVKKLRPSNRNLYIVKIKDYDGKKKFDKKQWHLFDFSDFLFQEVFETQLKKKEGFDDFFLPEEGRSLEITFDEGSFAGNKFAKTTRVDFVPRKKQYSDDIIDEIPNLDEILTILSYDEIEAKFFGEEHTTEETPKKDKKKKKKSKKEEVVEEEEAPKKEKKSKKAKKEKVVEEEEEAPKKKDKKKKKAAEEEVPTKKDKKSKKKVKEGTKKMPCPFKHKFGKDCDKFSECDDCEIWPECNSAKKSK